MLNVAFINVNYECSAEGSRIISAVLKRAGHRVRMIFLTKHAGAEFEPKDLKDLPDLLKGFDVVLMSFMSDTFLRALQVTQFIRKTYPKLPVVWGGVHATVASEECLQHVDYLCRGEGEEAATEFCDLYAAGRDVSGVANFWVRQEGKVHRNPMRPLIQDLDSLPYADYDQTDHYLYDRGSLAKATVPVLLRHHSTMPFGDIPTYLIHTARGCPFSCSFCYNLRYKELYGTNKLLRFRSPGHAMGELIWIRDNLGAFQRVTVTDDDFFARRKEELGEFQHLYLQEIAVPFACNVTPASLHGEKMRLMYDAGLRTLVMGVQSGSEDLNEAQYNRRFSNAKLLEKAVMLDREFNRKVDVLLDFIINNPYEGEEDVLQTIELMQQLPEWFAMNMYSMVFYPGTPLRDVALKDGIITGDPREYTGVSFAAQTVKGFDYITHVSLLNGCARSLVPRSVMRFLLSPSMRKVGRKIPRFLMNLVPWERLYPALWARQRARTWRGASWVQEVSLPRKKEEPATTAAA